MNFTESEYKIFKYTSPVYYFLALVSFVATVFFLVVDQFKRKKEDPKTKVRDFCAPIPPLPKDAAECKPANYTNPFEGVKSVYFSPIATAGETKDDECNCIACQVNRTMQQMKKNIDAEEKKQKKPNPNVFKTVSLKVPDGYGLAPGERAELTKEEVKEKELIAVGRKDFEAAAFFRDLLKEFND